MKNFLMKICAFFFRRLATYNNVYEKMKEPKRFYVAMTVGIIPFLIFDILALIAESKGFDVIGIIWIFFVIGIRIWWLHGSLKTWLPSDHEPYNGIKVG